MNKFKLKRTVQCKKCPFKKSTNPFEIPDGYCPTKHKELEKTIAKDTTPKTVLNAMACHHAPENAENYYCVGWLKNQLGIGNNITLRIKMLNCKNIGKIKTIGEQHETFEETLPM